MPLAGLEPATCCLGDDCLSSGLYGSVGSRQACWTSGRGESRFGRGPRRVSGSLDVKATRSEQGRCSDRFEDSNSSANVGVASKTAGQKMVLSTIDENLALFNNGSNGDSVPATVPEREPTPPLRSPIHPQVGRWLKAEEIEARPLLHYPGLGHEPKVAAIALREHMLPGLRIRQLGLAGADEVVPLAVEFRWRPDG